MKDKKVLSVGVIGLGIGNIHAKAIQKNKNAKLSFISDKKRIFKKLSKKFKCKFTKDARVILNNKLTKLVSIASYDNYHFSQIMSCIKKKKHIFVEKPFCQNIEQYKKIKRGLCGKKIYFSTNFVLRNHPKFKKIFQIIKNKKLGKIYHIEGDYNYGRLYKLTSGWRGNIPYYSVTQGGGIHMIDLMIWYIKSLPKTVIANGNKISTKNSKFKFLDNVTSLITFKNGVTAKVSSNFSCVMPHDHQMRIFGTKGSLTLSNDKILFYASREKNKKIKTIFFRKDKNYKSKILDEFINSIVERKKFKLISKKEVFSSMATCLAIDKSIKTKKIEKVKI